jgi:uncharacterized protein YjbI with pentapeptide repeats
MDLVVRSIATLSAGSLILALALPAAVSAVSYRDCSGQSIEAGADLHRCDLSGAVIIGLDLHGINLSRANLQDVNGGCDPDLPITNLAGARLAGADARRALLCDANLIGADLRGADLGDASLEDASLRSADASGIRLDEATAAFAQFNDMRLVNASLRATIAGSATFDGSDLRGADLSDAYLAHARFVEASLRGAELDRADLSMADLTGADLDRATGLATVICSSTICPDGTNSDANGGTCLGHLE